MPLGKLITARQVRASSCKTQHNRISYQLCIAYVLLFLHLFLLNRRIAERFKTYFHPTFAGRPFCCGSFGEQPSSSSYPRSSSTHVCLGLSPETLCSVCMDVASALMWASVVHPVSQVCKRLLLLRTGAAHHGAVSGGRGMWKWVNAPTPTDPPMCSRTYTPTQTHFKLWFSDFSVFKQMITEVNISWKKDQNLESCKQSLRQNYINTLHISEPTHYWCRVAFMSMLFLNQLPQCCPDKGLYMCIILSYRAEAQRVMC